MRRAASFLLATLLAPGLACAAAVAAHAGARPTESGCEEKPVNAAAAGGEDAGDVAGRSPDAAPSRTTGSVRGSGVRGGNPRWNRLLPGMFR